MAERTWLGTAADIKQETTIAVTGTWATADTATLTINGSSVTVTVGSDVATTDIVDILVQAVNSSNTTDLVNDESRNTGGQSVPEFSEVEAFDSGSTLTLKSRVAGVPFTVTASEVTAGTGALGSPTEAVAATGREHWDNANNWSGSTVPVSTDDVSINNLAAASIKYGLDQSAVTLTSLTITRGFATPKQVGLPQVRSTSVGDYAEYRDTYLKISATTVTVGEDSGTMTGLVRVDLGSAASTVNVQSTGTASETNVPALLLLGTNASNALYVSEGSSVGVAYFDSESSTVATIETAGTLHVGDSATLTNVDVNGGVFTTSSATTTLDISGGQATCYAGAHATVNVYEAGTLNYRSTGAITTLSVSGTLDCTLDPRGRTVTNIVTLHRGATLNDPNATLTLSGGFTIDHGLLDDVTLNLGYDRSYTVT
jgi:hypothetical protein